jgi:hypothetical protein
MKKEEGSKAMYTKQGGLNGKQQQDIEEDDRFRLANKKISKLPHHSSQLPLNKKEPNWYDIFP